jgi:hypothetical protein
MTYQPQTKWTLFRFAVRNSYVNAGLVTAMFIVVAFLRALMTDHAPISPLWAITVVAAFYLFALSLTMLRWYAYVARTKREARKKGWGE